MGSRKRRKMLEARAEERDALPFERDDETFFDDTDAFDHRLHKSGKRYHHRWTPKDGTEDE
jgi:hypothetical protein